MDGQMIPVEKEGGLNNVSDMSLNSTESSVDDENQKALDQTFIMNTSNNIEQCVCEHKYETGMVVVTVSNQFLRLLVQCRGVWLTTDVDPLKLMVIVDGIRIKEVFSIRIGTMGHIVTKECTDCSTCQIDTVTPVLVWFGETQVPSVRGLSGLVVGREDKRVVVQLEQSEELVLFHGDSDEEEELALHSQVLVWAWKKVVQNGAVKFLEGAAFIKIVNNVKRIDEDDANDSIDVSSENIFSPIRFQSTEVPVPPYFVEKYQDLDESLSVSFGSVSAHEETEEFNLLIEDGFEHGPEHATSKINEDFDEIYFQSLFWRLASSKLDEIIESQFDKVLAANNLLKDYSDHTEDFEKITKKVPTPLISNTTLVSPFSPTEPECEDSWTDFPKSNVPVVAAAVSGVSKFVTRKLSHPPLSPIPEENTDRELFNYNIDDTGELFHSGLREYSTPTQARTNSDNTVSPSSPYTGSNSPVSMMDSGYSDTFAGAMDTRETASLVVLEQFLEFTEFPEHGRADLIRRFLVYSDKLNL